VPHLNELQEKFGDKGLSIVGVTSEGSGPTEKWVEEHSMKYAYAYDKSKALFHGVGASGYPSAILVDASGNIAYLGHPGSITAEIVQGALAGALATPIYEWPKELSGAAKDMRKGDLAGALEELGKFGETHADITAAVTAMVKSRVAQLEKARDAGDWLRVENAGETLLKGLGKLEEATTVKGILDTLAKDKGAQAVLKAQKKVEKMFADDIKKSQFDRCEKDLHKICEEHAGTAAERDAKAGLERLKALRAS